MENGKKSLKEKKVETIRHILDAATEVFADAGFAGARIDKIAERAGVNKAMIYYRIGDKEALYTEVLHNVFGDAAERIARNIEQGQPPEEKLKNYVMNMASLLERHPYLPHIMMREMASGAHHLNEVIATDLSRILGVISGILDDGVKKGAFIRTDPLIVHMMVIGVMLLFRVSMPVREIFYTLLHDKGIKKSSFKDMVGEIEKLVLRALKV